MDTVTKDKVTKDGNKLRITKARQSLGADLKGRNLTNLSSFYQTAGGDSLASVGNQSYQKLVGKQWTLNKQPLSDQSKGTEAFKTIKKDTLKGKVPTLKKEGATTTTTTTTTPIVKNYGTGVVRKTPTSLDTRFTHDAGVTSATFETTKGDSAAVLKLPNRLPEHYNKPAGGQWTKNNIPLKNQSEGTETFKKLKSYNLTERTKYEEKRMEPYVLKKLGFTKKALFDSFMDRAVRAQNPTFNPRKSALDKAMGNLESKRPTYLSYNPKAKTQPGARPPYNADMQWADATKTFKASPGTSGGYKTLSQAIAARNSFKKGTEGYANAQNAINKAYGSKVRH